MVSKARKFWATRGFHSASTKGHWMSVVNRAEDNSEKLKIKKRYQSKERLPDEDWPTELFVKYAYDDLKKSQGAIIKTLKDVFRVRGFIIVSKRFHDLLQDFNLGQTAFKAVPVYEYDRSTRFPEDYYVIQILEHRSYARIEEMENIHPAGFGGRYFWYAGPEHKAVLELPITHELDLWMDDKIHEWVFVSDRLRKAIKAAGIKGTELYFRKCELING